MAYTPSGNPANAARGVAANLRAEFALIATAISELAANAVQTLTNKVIALGSNTVSGTKAQFNTACTDGEFIYDGGALGTPSGGTLTNCTGLPVATGVSGLGANVAAFLATPSSANLAAAVTDETGTGALVFGTSPTIAAPVITGDTPMGAAGAPSFKVLAVPSAVNYLAALGSTTGGHCTFGVIGEATADLVLVAGDTAAVRTYHPLFVLGDNGAATATITTPNAGGITSFEIYPEIGLGGAPSAMAVSGGGASASSTFGGFLYLRGGDAAGASSDGGYVYIEGGAGTATDGEVRIGTAQTGAVRIGAGGVTTTVAGTLSIAGAVVASSSAPASAADTGTAGEIRFDTNYIYRCVATNTWTRAALSTW